MSLSTRVTLTLSFYPSSLFLFLTTHTHTLIDSTYYLFLTHSLSLTHTHSLSLSLSHTHPHTLTSPFSAVDTISVYIIFNLSLSLPTVIYFSLSYFLIFSAEHSLYYRLSLSHSHTHTPSVIYFSFSPSYTPVISCTNIHFILLSLSLPLSPIVLLFR